MDRCFEGQGRRRRGAQWAAALCVATLAGGCGKAPAEQSEERQSQAVLAALMEDGPLPAGMMMPAEPLPPPPRFCFEDEGGGIVRPGGPVIGGPMVEVGGGPVTAPGPTEPPPPPAGGTGGMGGGTAGSGSGSDDALCARVPISSWSFDDCNPFRTDLFDSSNQGHTAYRNVEQTCASGQEGQAVAFARNSDLVYAPDQPDFALDKGLTVAAWVKPEKINGLRTLFRKRDDASSAFALVINEKKYQLVVRLRGGKLVSVQAPATANAWTHVAGTYDNQTLRLYLDGVEVARTRAAGTIAKGPGPLLMGNDASNRRLQGLMDNAWFNTLAAPADKIMQLTCIHVPPTLSVSPADGPAVATDTPVDYTLTLTNNNGPTCAPERFFEFVGFPSGFTAVPDFIDGIEVGSGESVANTFAVQAGGDVEPDTYSLSFEASSDDGNSFALTTATFTVTPPSGCFVQSSRELTIRHVSVVDDPIRTSMTGGDPSDPRTGAWSFGRLMEQLSPTPAQAADVTEAMFRTFLSDQTVNTFTIPARPNMDPIVLQPWPRTAAGKLDLTRAPLRLLAIVNRLDLKDLARGKAGEGRIVFGITDPSGEPLQFTVILEYLLPASNEQEYRAWADAFHALQALPFPSEQYNAALQAITDRFAGRGSMPSMPNGNGIIDIRTNEIALLPGQIIPWQMREFRLSPTTGFMEPFPVFDSPDKSFNDTAALGRFINENEPAILAETHEVPLRFEGAPFQAASILNNFIDDTWNAPGINNPDARHKFAINTCNGCHGQEAGVFFLQISPRSPGQESALSSFLTGVDVSDPITGEVRHLAELARRRQLMQAVVCGEDDGTP